MGKEAGLVCGEDRTECWQLFMDLHEDTRSTHEMLVKHFTCNLIAIINIKT